MMYLLMLSLLERLHVLFVNRQQSNVVDHNFALLEDGK